MCITISDIGNFEPPKRPLVSGPGQGGHPYHMPEHRANDVAESESEYGMNIAASDDIAMNRYKLLIYYELIHEVHIPVTHTDSQLPGYASSCLECPMTFHMHWHKLTYLYILH